MSLFERQAPELRVQRWIGEDGGISVAPLKLSDLGTGPKILFAFQHWCRGCHAHGFPTLQRLHGALSSKGVGFAVIQTGATLPTFMEDYRTRGTPLFTVIDADGLIVFSDFNLDADLLVKELEQA